VKKIAQNFAQNHILSNLIHNLNHGINYQKCGLPTSVIFQNLPKILPGVKIVLRQKDKKKHPPDAEKAQDHNSRV
jgi:hypothetical protein